jgi:rhodanese-related sulfurtransferase/quercetin dioxygenase-like cupin family protein
VYLHPQLEPVRANLLRSPLLGDGVMAAEALAGVAVEIADLQTLWRPILRHDPTRRWYERLLLTSRIEIWLIGWAAGQGTPMHDHGGAHGAFAVVDGGLVEAATDARTAHRAGSVSWFGPDWVHTVVNAADAPATSIHAYSPPSLPMRFHDHTIDELLARARARLARLEPREAAKAVEAGALLVDTRPAAQRQAEGEVPGALVIERNVLEWRLDPASPHRIPGAAGYDRQVIVMCSEGYSSSLAAASLQDLGLYRATNLVGGFRAWAAAGLPFRRT